VREGSESSQRVLKFVAPDELPYFYAFGPFLLDARQRRLMRDGAGVALAPKTTDLLLLLVQSHGRLLTKEALLATLWPDTFVEESNLVQNVFVLRKALGEGSYIETVPRRGYLFTAGVRELHETPDAERAEELPAPAVARRASIVRVGAVLVAAAAAAFMGLHMFDASRTLPARYVPSVQAQEAYLKGRYHWNRRTPADFGKATEYYRTAVESDPQFALAWAGLADAYNFLGDAPRAKVAARRALEIDESLAAAHAALANAAMFHDFDVLGAERELRRAIEIDPEYATAHHWYAFALVSQGRREEALAAIERARALDPTSPVINADVAAILYYARRYDEAILQLRRTIDLEPGFAQSHQLLALTYARKGMSRESLAEATLAGMTSDQVLDLRTLAGERDAIARMHELEKEPDARVRGVSNYVLARAWAAAGDAQGAVRSLERARAAREADLLLLGVDPAFDGVRDDSSFRAFMGAG
jgi:DNA-binding winged helix-turn-helix (wHTH) protein/Tfp pilus assembly protein PilF